MSKEEYAPTVLRLGLGILFLITGIGKFMNPSGVSGMLTGIGFPFPMFWAWILIIFETLGGLALVLGYKVKWAVVPLIIIIIVAIVTVTRNNTIQLGKDIAILGGLLAIYLRGKGGKFSLKN